MKTHDLKHSLPFHHMPIADCNSRNFPTVAKVRMISRASIGAISINYFKRSASLLLKPPRMRIKEIYTFKSDLIACNEYLVSKIISNKKVVNHEV
jgi:hypothetical protein